MSLLQVSVWPLLLTTEYVYALCHCKQSSTALQGMSFRADALASNADEAFEEANKTSEQEQHASFLPTVLRLECTRLLYHPVGLLATILSLLDLQHLHEQLVV